MGPSESVSAPAGGGAAVGAGQGMACELARSGAARRRERGRAVNYPGAAPWCGVGAARDLEERSLRPRAKPGSEAFRSWPIPSGGVHAGIVRHMRPTRDGNLLIHQSSTNRIILVTLPPAATQ